MPILLRRKRRVICCRWLRALTVNSRSTPPPTGPGSAGTAWTVGLWTVLMGTSPAAGSREPDTWIEHGVQQVGDQVEQDDEEGADQQPAEDHVDVVVREPVLQQVPAHAVPGEDLLGDD